MRRLEVYLRKGPVYISVPLPFRFRLIYNAMGLRLERYSFGEYWWVFNFSDFSVLRLNPRM